MKTKLTALVVLIASALPAFAGQCPGLMGQIDAAMTTASVDDATKTQIMALYDSGKAAHAAGDHAKSVADLGQAMNLLGL